MVTGITGANMTANVLGAPVPAGLKEAAPKSDRRVSILRFFQKLNWRMRSHQLPPTQV